jgi:hypothetical protein
VRSLGFGGHARLEQLECLRHFGLLPTLGVGQVARSAALHLYVLHLSRHRQQEENPDRHAHHLHDQHRFTSELVQVFPAATAASGSAIPLPPAV